MVDATAVATIIAAGVASIPASLAALGTRRTRRDMGTNGESLSKLSTDIRRVVDRLEADTSIIDQLAVDTSYVHDRMHQVLNVLTIINGKLEFPPDVE